MPIKPKLLHEDSQWLPFCERYSGDIVRFAVEVMGFIPTHQQIDMMRAVAPGRSMTSVVSGHGCFAEGTEIMRATGECVPVEGIKPGDVLMGPDGKSTQTVGALRRGREAMYRFTYADGTSHIFNESHILCLVATNSKGRRKAGDKITVTVRDWLTWGSDKKRCHAIYRSGVDLFFNGDSWLSLPIDPYIMGVWLGDGSSEEPAVTTADPEIESALRDFARPLGLRVVKVRNSENSHVLSLSGVMGSKNPVTESLRGLGVWGNKHIPKCYLLASKADRLNLLAGLLDTDGSKDKSGFDFIQKNEQLARQTAWLARSVGCHSTIRRVQKRCGNNGKVGTYWRVTIGRNIEQIPVRIERKKATVGPRQRDALHFSIRSCEPLGEGDYFGFEIDGDDRRFLGGDFTVLHNTGKTASLGIIVLWHLLCYPQSNTLLTANDVDQLKATLWKEIGLSVERIRSGPHGWIAEHVVIQADGTAHVAGFRDTWFVESKTANEKTANKLAGRHNEWLLIIADEASSLPDGVLNTLRGALTEQNNRMLMTSQGTRNAGFFYRTHHALSIVNGGEWAALRLSSLESPLVTDDAIRDLWNSYDDDERRIRLLGQFPIESGKYMMPLTTAEKLYQRGQIIGDDEPYGWFLLVDVASGEGLRDKSAVVVARVIGYGDRKPDARRVEVVAIPVHTNNIRANRLAGAVTEQLEPYEGAMALVDSGGLGINVCQDLEDQNKQVHRVNWGNPCFQNRNKERYLNLRAQAMHQAARAAKEGRLSVLTGAYRNVLLAQSSRIPKTFTDKGRIRVPPKHGKEWEGMGSPDLWDAVCFAFLEGVVYTPVHAGSKAVQAVGANVESEAESLFADVA